VQFVPVLIKKLSLLSIRTEKVVQFKFCTKKSKTDLLLYNCLETILFNHSIDFSAGNSS
jgi:hypothetical protein